MNSQEQQTGAGVQDGMGRGTRVPDIPRLLALLAARQRGLPTAAAMRGSTGQCGRELVPADRMVRLFTLRDSLAASQAGGSFNEATAQALSRARQGEDGVYRGA